jgi:hypothetical protein
MDKQVEKTLERMSDRMAALLQNDSDWKESAEQIEDALERSNLIVETERNSPRDFARSLFLNNVNMSLLAETALRNRVDIFGQDDPFEMVNNLLPSDRHLD